MGLESIVKTVTRAKEESTKALAEESTTIFQENKPNELWKRCKYRKVVNGEHYCTFFMAKCAKEKCDRKYMKL